MNSDGMILVLLCMEKLKYGKQTSLQVTPRGLCYLSPPAAHHHQHAGDVFTRGEQSSRGPVFCWDVA